MLNRQQKISYLHFEFVKSRFNDRKAHQAAKDETKQRNFDKRAHSMSFDRGIFFAYLIHINEHIEFDKSKRPVIKIPSPTTKNYARKIKEPWLPFN